jgi:hypothetical protein
MNSSFTLEKVQLLIADVAENEPPGDKRRIALEELSTLSQTDDNREALCRPQLGLVELLTKLLASDELNLACLHLVATCFAEWAALKENKLLLCRESSGLPQLLYNLILDPHLCDPILIFFLNCALEPVNHSYLLSERLGIAMYVRQQMLSNPNWLYPFWFFTNVVGTMEEKDVPLLLDWRIHEIFMNRLLEEGPDPKQWFERSQGSTYRSLFAIFYFCTFKNSGPLLKELEIYKSYFMKLFLSKEREKFPSAIILCILSSSSAISDEQVFTSSGSGSSLLRHHPEILESLITIFYTDFFYSDKHDSIVRIYRRLGYNYGIFKLRAITFTLKELALDPFNKEIMINDALLVDLMIRGIEIFIFNFPECSAVGIHYEIRQHAGGGGADYDTIENLMELLYHLVNYFPNHSALNEFLTKSHEERQKLYWEEQNIVNSTADIPSDPVASLSPAPRGGAKTKENDPLKIRVINRKKVLLACSPPVPMREMIEKLYSLRLERRYSFRLTKLIDLILQRLR